MKSPKILEKFSFALLLFFLFCGAIESQQISRKVIAEETFLPLISHSDSLSSIKNLRNEINRVLSKNNIHSSKFSIAVYSIERGDYIYENNADTKLTPASTTKLVTAFTTLAAKGKNFQISTSVFSDVKIDSKGVVNGNLYLYGMGDALFSNKDMDKLVDSLKAMGLTKITGNVYADASFFDGIHSRFKYSKDYDEVQALPPISALSIEKNEVTLYVYAGEKINVNFIPQSSAFATTIQARVLGSSQGFEIENEDKDFRFYSLESQEYGDDLLALAKKQNKNSSKKRKNKGKNSNVSRAGIVVNSQYLSNGIQNFTIKGSLSPNRSQSFRYTMRKPELVAAGALKAKLQSRGIEVSGEILEKEMNDRLPYHKLAQFNRPVIDLLMPLNKHSDNYIAEHLFKMNGGIIGNNKNNYEGSRELVSKMMPKMGVDFSGVEINDGSGLSRRNKVSSRNLCELLSAAYFSDFGREFDSTLAIAGIDGTLRNRMKGSLAERNLRAKTGTHGNVSALAGYVKSLDGEHFVFSMIFNGGNLGGYKQTEDEIGKILAQFFYFNDSE